MEILIPSVTVAVCAEGAEESVTVMLKLVLPGFVGVPEMIPVIASRFRPGGRDPDEIDHLYGVVPPVALACEL